MRRAFTIVALLTLFFHHRVSAQCSVSIIGDTSQTVCVGTAITQINFYTSFIDNASSSGLPGDLLFAFKKVDSTGLALITGTPQTVGTYHYNISFTTNGCSQQISGTIRVVNAVNITFVGDSIQTICDGKGVTQEISFSGPDGTFCRWINDNPAIGLPARGTTKIPSFEVQNTTDDIIQAKIVVKPSLPTKKNIYFGYTGSLQSWVIPANTIAIKITAMGARGGDVTLTTPSFIVKNGGFGALTSASFNVGADEFLHVGDNLQILVGRQGGDIVNPFISVGGGGGGGGSFIAKGNAFATFELNSLLAAGGGGGGTYNSGFGGEDGEAGGTTVNNNFSPGAGGLNLANLADGAGGAGVSDKGSDKNQPCRSTGGTAIRLGGAGGAPDCVWGGGAGGFGGGGGGGLTGGGGGGFSGGNSYSVVYAAGGGSSFIDTNRTDSLHIPGFNSGDGFVHIEYLVQSCTGADRDIKITVPPVARLKAVPNRIQCSGTTIQPAIVFTNTTKGNSVIYKWTRLGPNVGIPLSGRGSSFQYALTNATKNALIDTIIVVPCYVINADTCDGIADTFTVTVNPVVVVDALTPQVVCNNTFTAPVIFNTQTTDGTIDYSWTRTGGGLQISGKGNVDSFSIINSHQSIDTIILTVTPGYINSSGGPTCTGTIARDTIWSIPTVPITPVSDQVKCNGAPTDSIRLSSPAAGTGWQILFDWQNNNPAIGLNGSLTRDPVIHSFTATNNTDGTIQGLINVTPTFSYKGRQCPGVSSLISIYVHPKIRVNTIPDTAWCNGQMVDPIYFSSPTPGMVTAFDFKWKSLRSAISSLDSGYNVIPTFVAGNNTNTTLQDSIIIIPTLNSLGISCVGIPDTFKVTVNPTATIIVSDKQFCDSQATNLIVFNSPTQAGTKTYNWINNNTAIGLGSIGSGDIQPFTTHNNYDTPIVASVIVTMDFANGGVTCPGRPDTFEIIVNHRVSLDPVADQFWCNRQLSDPIALQSSPQRAGSVDYTWVNKDTTIGLGPTGTGLSIPVFTTKNNGDSTRVAYVMVTPILNIDSLSCPGTTSPIKVSIIPTAKVDRISDRTVCFGSRTNQITFTSPTIRASGNTIDYTWTNVDTTIGLQATDIGNVPPFTAQNPTDSPITSRLMVTALYTSGTLTCTGASDSFLITVNPEPKMNLMLSQIKCNGAISDSINYSSPTVKGGSMLYEWKNSDNFSIGLTRKSDTGDIEPFEVRNAGITPVTATYTVTPIYHRDTLFCRGAPNSFTITVNPTPRITAIRNFADSVFCNGEHVDSIAFSGNVAGSIFRWVCIPDVGFTPNAAGFAIPPFTASNPGDIPVYAYVSVNAIANGCLGPDTVFSITVNPSPPKPDFKSLSTFPSNITLALCKGTENVNFNIIAPDSAIYYSWAWHPVGAAGEVRIKNPNSPNTVMSFGESGTYRINVVAATGAGCIDSVAQLARVTSQDGIEERRIIQKQPGNLLFYPDNSMDPGDGYEWGYDSLLQKGSPNLYSAPIKIAGQTLQVFTPHERFLDANKKLDTTLRAFWVLLQKGSCETRVYYNGPYASGRFVPTAAEDKTVVLKVLPNPNNGRFDLSLEGNIYGNVEAVVYNQLGQRVFVERFDKTTHRLIRQIDVGDLPNGLYYLDLHSSDLKSAETRFMIQR